MFGSMETEEATRIHLKADNSGLMGLNKLSMNEKESSGKIGWGRMKMSSNGNIFRVTGHLCGKFTSDRWIPRTKKDTSLMAFMKCWSRL